MSDWNMQIIQEFRNNGGVVGGVFTDRPLLLLHTTGAKSGRARLHPLMYQRVDGGVAIFGSKGGARAHPAWYHNVLVNPDVEIELGTERLPMRARVVAGAERDVIWTKQKVDYPFFAEYEAATDRTIPVIILEPR